MSVGQKKKMALPWTSSEDIILIDMVLNGKSVNEITTAFPNRPRDSIAGRIRRLRAAGTLPAVEKAIGRESTNPQKPRKRKSKRIESTKDAKTDAITLESTTCVERSASCVEGTIESEPSAISSESTIRKERKPRKPKEPPYIPPERPLHPLERIGHKDCRWPVGDPRNAGFHFCGQPVESGFPYCREHTLKAFASGTSKLREELEVA